ncbi:MAG TPA: CHASE2 domain-containing protein [Syntrophales bacterium]|jgi:adenylate cyclase|nr:CHASE2 domain-containing protein [Syntrophales bacterium]HON22219.1 CHASE2 domain-containing protein [Syntrophales bacterium]HOU77740.1 CHASE2 domain-containing protein [Syntrophales bacterium]HPC32116.1 CHASE2 domain-containing protein [Syntrophales bacterium]HQG33717.1 CHASE2 domain-containing protein [Syntrophales bacterium]
MRISIKNLLVLSPFKITVAVVLIFLAMFFMDPKFLRFMELKALDLRMVSRGQLPTSGQVIIATVDEKSLSEVGRWPWSRKVTARLVEALKEYGAKAVGFDIVFAEPEQNESMNTLKEIYQDAAEMGIHDPRLMGILEDKAQAAQADAILAGAIAKAKNVSLGYFFHTSEKDLGFISEEYITTAASLIGGSMYPMVKAKGPVGLYNIITAYAPVPSIKEIAEAGENSGYFNAFPDSDGVIRWSPLVIRFQENFYHSLPIALLMQYLDYPMLVLNLAEFGVESVMLGDIRIPTDESGRLLINYLGPAKTFPHYSISDIMQGRIAPELIKGKIVVVGATATGIYDLRVTPFSPVYPGVELHATVVEDILQGNFLEQSAWTTFLDICSIVIFGMVLGIAIPRVKAVQGIFLALVLVGGFIVANTFVFAKYNTWLNLIYPVLTMMTIYLVITVYRYFTEEREKKKIRGAFQYYLTASVINELLKDPGKLKLGGDKKDLTVMFSDIRGFTTISEKLTPEELVHLLNEYLTAMTDIVFKYEGLLDKYIGDAIMAVFGAPVEQPDHALRCCRTALEMMTTLKVLQEKWEKEGRPYVDIGVGINSGDMVVGNMGSNMRFDYTVMGDNVNLSSRLEGINKEYGTHIVISEYTYEVVKEEMFCRELDAVRVKGKKLPVKIYELICERKDAAPHEEYIRRFHEGLAHYKAARWDEAIAAFQQVLEIRPDDPPSKLYIQRCQDLKGHPPEGEWDGVFTMTRK